MRLNKKILPLTVLLAVGIALTACGSSGTAASTPASSAVPASSHVAEEGVTEPINMLSWSIRIWLVPLEPTGYSMLAFSRIIRPTPPFARRE